jgi:hypothetical protein
MLMIVVGAKQVFGIWVSQFALDFIGDSGVLSIASGLTGCSMSEKLHGFLFIKGCL